MPMGCVGIKPMYSGELMVSIPQSDIVCQNIRAVFTTRPVTQMRANQVYRLVLPRPVTRKHKQRDVGLKALNNIIYCNNRLVLE